MYKGIRKHRLTEQSPPNIPRTALMLGKTIETTHVTIQKPAVIPILADLVKTDCPVNN